MECTVFSSALLYDYWAKRFPYEINIHQCEGSLSLAQSCNNYSNISEFLHGHVVPEGLI